MTFSEVLSTASVSADETKLRPKLFAAAAVADDGLTILPFGVDVANGVLTNVLPEVFVSVDVVLTTIGDLPTDFDRCF